MPLNFSPCLSYSIWSYFPLPRHNHRSFLSHSKKSSISICKLMLQFYQHEYASWVQTKILIVFYVNLKKEKSTYWFYLFIFKILTLCWKALSSHSNIQLGWAESRCRRGSLYSCRGRCRVQWWNSEISACNCQWLRWLRCVWQSKYKKMLKMQIYQILVTLAICLILSQVNSRNLFFLLYVSQLN